MLSGSVPTPGEDSNNGPERGPIPNGNFMAGNFIVEQSRSLLSDIT